MSWESTVPYYTLLNRAVAARLGGYHSAKVLLASVDFHEVEELQRRGAWEEAGELLAGEAVKLERAGADFLVLATNTMHRVAPAIEAAVGIPLLHIADPTFEAIERAGIATVGLLGTRFTMEGTFYRGRLEERGLTVLVPGEEDRELVHRVIYEELCLGRVEAGSRRAYEGVIERLVARGAGGVIFGCTEIGLLVGAESSRVPVFDTTELHALAAAERAMGA